MLANFACRARAAALALFLSTALPLAQATDFQWWVSASPNATPNGAITLKNASGASRTIASNPTGANLSTRTANTQAPTVVVQATQALPIKNIGDACTQATYNSTATEGLAITSDRRLVLTCDASNSKWIPLRVYAVENDACNIIYKTSAFAVGDKLTLAVALPTGTTASDASGLQLSCQSGVWAKQVKIAPNTQTLGWSEAQFVPTTRYCPAGYTAVSSVAYSAPSGRGACQTTIFNYTSGTGSQYAGNCGYYPGDSSFSHYLTCMKF